MNPFLIITLGIIGLALILLTLNHDNGSTFGLPNDIFSQLIYSASWAALIGTGLFHRGEKLRDIARNIIIWILIVLILFAGYTYFS